MIFRTPNIPGPVLQPISRTTTVFRTIAIIVIVPILTVTCILAQILADPLSERSRTFVEDSEHLVPSDTIDPTSHLQQSDLMLQERGHGRCFALGRLCRIHVLGSNDQTALLASGAAVERLAVRHAYAVSGPRFDTVRGADIKDQSVLLTAQRTSLRPGEEHAVKTRLLAADIGTCTVLGGAFDGPAVAEGEKGRLRGHKLHVDVVL